MACNTSAAPDGLNQSELLCPLPRNITNLKDVVYYPWTCYYTSSILIFSFLGLVAIVHHFIAARAEAGCNISKRHFTRAFTRLWRDGDIRGFCVFCLSMRSLAINFFVPYMSINNAILNHGWCRTPTQDSLHWTKRDLAVNCCLLILLLIKPFEVTLQATFRFLRKCLCCHYHVGLIDTYKNFKDRDYLTSNLWRACKDWEFVAACANLPLIGLQIREMCYGVDCNKPITYWNMSLTNLQFLRIFCVTWLCDEIIRFFPKLKIAVGTIMRRVTWIACSFLAFAAWIHLVEVLGDPWVSTYNGQKDLPYWRLVAFLYGKLVLLDVTSTQLNTAISKISVYLAQALALVFLVQIIPEMLKKLPKILQMRSFSTIYWNKSAKYVLLLGSVNPDAVARFAQSFCKTNPKEKILVLLDPEASDEATEKMDTVAGRYKHFLTVISGSVFQNKDFKKNISAKCQCAFFFANESAQNHRDEDNCNFLRVHTLKQHYPDLRVIVKVLVFENKERFRNIPNWHKDNWWKKTISSKNGRECWVELQADRVICTAEIQFALLAQRCLAPGISQVVHNWFDLSDHSENDTIRTIVLRSRIGLHWTSAGCAAQPDEATANTRHRSSPWRRCFRKQGTQRRQQNGDAEAHQLNAPLLNNGMNENLVHGFDHVEDARTKFQLLCRATLFAMLSDGELHLHPPAYLHLRSGSKLFLITKTKLKKLYAVLCPNCWEISGKRQKLATVPESTSTSKLELEFPIGTEGKEANKDTVCDITGQYNVYLLPRTEMVSKQPRGMEVLKPVPVHHVIVCVVSDRDPSSVGLVNFIKPLRAVQEIDPPLIVVLASKDFLEKEWVALDDFPNIEFVEGDPLNHDHLRYISIETCRMCVIVDASERPKEESDKWQQSNIDLIWPILPKHFYRHVNAVLATASVAEYLKGFHKPSKLIEETTQAISAYACKYCASDGKVPEGRRETIKRALTDFIELNRGQVVTTTKRIAENLETSLITNEPLSQYLKRLRETHGNNDSEDATRLVFQKFRNFSEEASHNTAIKLAMNDILLQLAINDFLIRSEKFLYSATRDITDQLTGLYHPTYKPPDRFAIAVNQLISYTWPLALIYRLGVPLQKIALALTEFQEECLNILKVSSNILNNKMLVFRNWAAIGSNSGSPEISFTLSGPVANTSQSSESNQAHDMSGLFANGTTIATTPSLTIADGKELRDRAAQAITSIIEGFREVNDRLFNKARLCQPYGPLSTYASDAIERVWKIHYGVDGPLPLESFNELLFRALERYQLSANVRTVIKDVIERLFQKKAELSDIAAKRVLSILQALCPSTIDLNTHVNLKDLIKTNLIAFGDPYDSLPKPKETETAVKALLVSLRQARDPVPEEIITCLNYEAVALISWKGKEMENWTQSYVSPDCAPPQLIDGLMLKCYYDKDILDAVRLFLLGGYKDGFGSPGNKKSRGCQYAGNQTIVRRACYSSIRSPNGTAAAGFNIQCPTLSSFHDKALEHAFENIRNHSDSKFNLILQRDDDYDSFIRRNKKYAIIGRQPTTWANGTYMKDNNGMQQSGERSNSELRYGFEDYNYFVLEQPFFVDARTRLLLAIKKRLQEESPPNNDADRKDILDMYAQLEILPKQLLQLMENGSSTMPGANRPDYYQRWVIVYYWIMLRLSQDDKFKERYARLLPSNAEAIADVVLQHNHVGVGAGSGVIWKLPKVIHEYLSLVFDRIEAPANTAYFYKQSKDFAGKVLWRDIAPIVDKL
ncbi:uncharacterized protein LOC129601900 isoform X2 [Paramacrobiotus metropolitanus]|uniref:uncharacterized protein LOC129601900 isoform X2 n=1 Tax=Paramacrobiotus metropolitanus TaxID=2943436 RepID=UPI0024458DB5|nr:uncharacterized protein LOC129601900 isoform X2 [Paramacrobiotus metropolitanus]